MSRSPAALLMVAVLLAGCAGASPSATPIVSSLASPTATAAGSPGPTCTGELTPAQTEGPYFKLGSPEETSLVGSGLPGTPLTLTGFVLGADCQPVADAALDFWQADDSGAYDNAGYTLRGHLTADAAGRFSLGTIVPGLYPGRTRHIHVKVQAPSGPLLTTQLYLPDEPSNASDGIFDAKLVMAVQPAGDGLAATFTFVVATR